MNNLKQLLSKVVLSVLAVSILFGGGAIEALANTGIAPRCSPLTLRSYFVNGDQATAIRTAPGRDASTYGGSHVVMAQPGTGVTVLGNAVNGWRPIRVNGIRRYIRNSRLSFTSAVACLSLPIDER
ncbi:MAG: hypothetical protein FWF59_03935 [Turicibacter sp.]|nr:hypothetical protein [Turicibacter sp.]